MIYLFLADGFEQVEALTPLDILRRTNTDIKTVSITGSHYVTSTHSLTVKADILPEDIVYDDTFTGVILPGGMPGAENLDKHPDVKKALSYANEKNALIAAICAAPFVLGHMGILEGKSAVCYPGFEGELAGADVPDISVCICKNIITAKGAGVSLDFALAIAEYAASKEAADRVAEAIQCRK